MLNKPEFYKELESILELGSGSLKGHETLDEISWDSMSVVMFIATADQNYSVAVAPSKLAAARTVADLYDLVSPSL